MPFVGLLGVLSSRFIQPINGRQILNRQTFKTISVQNLPTNEVNLISTQAGSALNV